MRWMARTSTTERVFLGSAKVLGGRVGRFRLRAVIVIKAFDSVWKPDLQGGYILWCIYEHG